MSRCVRIVRIITRLNIGGPSIHASLLTNRMAQERFSTCLVVGRPERDEGNRIGWVRPGPGRVVELPFLRRPIHPLRDAIAFAHLLRIVWRERPQVVHTHTAKAGTLGRLAGLAYNWIGPGRKSEQRALLVHTFHGHVLEGYFSKPASRLFTGIERLLARGTDCLIAVSPRVRDELLGEGIGRREQWRVVPLGLDLTPLQQLPFPNGSAPLRCGLVGRLVPIKNPALFVEAVGRLAPLVQGTIVGSGPLKSELEETVRRRGLEQAITFTGWREDLPVCYAQMDVLCITSWNEGTPASVIEAMAAGRATVATDVGGIRDLLGIPESVEVPAGGFTASPRGLLVRPGDARGLAGALRKMAEQPDLRRKIGEEGRVQALSKFGAERLIRDISLLYEQLNDKARESFS